MCVLFNDQSCTSSRAEANLGTIITANGSVLFRLLRDSETVSYSLFP